MPDTHDLDLTAKVQVYRNLTRGCWSVRQHGRVCAHLSELQLKDVQMTVQPGGQRRVRKTRHKVVHAWLSGFLVEAGSEHPGSQHLHYNPYCDDHFHLGDNVPVHHARHAHFTAGGQVYVQEGGASLKPSVPDRLLFVPS